jgi:septal ring factor EnvC (AmiA/AmiB activator)
MLEYVCNYPSYQKGRLKTELESAEIEWKKLNKILKQKEKKVYNLEKEITKVKEDLKIEKAALINFRAQVNKEKKDMEKRNNKMEKKEVLNNLKEE